MSPDADLTATRALSDQSGRARLSWLPKVFGYDFFISFKLGASPRGSQSYASDLARCLRELDYTVFYSEEEAAPGAELDATLVKALHRSRILVVIATPGALSSPWVRKEVEEFRVRRPSRPIILINVDRAIEALDDTVQTISWLGHKGRIWLDETAVAVQDGIVSSTVVERIRLAPQFLRANLMLRGSVATVIVTLAALTVFAWIKNNESRDRLVAYNLSQGRASLTAGRALEAAPSLLRVYQDGEQSPQVRFMLRRAFASIDRLLARFDSTAIKFSADGKSVAIASKDGSIEIRNSQDLSIKAILVRHDAIPASALMFSPDGKALIVEAAMSRDLQSECIGGVPSGAEVTLWDAVSGGLLQNFSSHHSMMLSCQHTFFAEQGQEIAMAAWSTQISDLYWAASSYDRTAALRGTTSETADGVCRWVSTALERQQEEVGLCSGHIIGVASDGEFVAVGPWGMPQRDIDVWSLSRGSRQTLSFGRDTFARSAVFSPDGERIAVTLSDGVEVWRLQDSVRIANLVMETTDTPVTFSPDGNRLIAIRGERDVQILDASNLESLAVLAGHGTKIRKAAFSADGTRVLTGGDDGVAKLWDGWTGRLLGSLEGHRGPVIDAGFSPDDHLIFTRDNGHTYLWDNRSLTIPLTLGDDPLKVRWWSLPSFELFEHSPDSSQIVLSHHDLNPGTLYALWDTKSGVLRGQWRAQKASARWPNAASHSEPSSTPQCETVSEEFSAVEPLASDGFGTTVVLDSTADGQNVLVQHGRMPCTSIRLEGHRARITAAAIDATMGRVMTADERGEIRIWNAQNGLLMTQVHAESPVRKLVFLSEDLALALNERNMAVVFDVSLEQRSFTELQEKLYCSELTAPEAHSDLVPADPKCDIAVPSRDEWASATANALLMGAWSSRHQRSAVSQLLEAAALYQKVGDVFGVARVTIALRALALEGGDARQASELDLRARELIAQLAQDENQRFRLLRLGELAFNEFNDVELAKLSWASLLARSPEERAAQLALWQTSIFDHPNQGIMSGGSGSIREAVLIWISAVATGKPIDDYAFNLWNTYAGSTIDPVYESMDFRGLQRQLDVSSLSQSLKRTIGDVLIELERPGNRSDQIKRLLRVPNDATTIGP